LIIHHFGEVPYLYFIAVYQVNDSFVVRKCCDSGYTWHELEGATINKLPQCNCEIVTTGLTNNEAFFII